MDAQTLESYKKRILLILKNINKGVYDINKINIFDLTKKGIPKEFIAKTIAEYCIENEPNLNTDLVELVISNNVLLPLINNENDIDVAIKVIEEFKGMIGGSRYMNILFSSNFNMKLFLNTEDMFSDKIGSQTISLLFDLIEDSDTPWEGSNIKRFFIYFLNDSDNLRISAEEIGRYFSKMDIVLKRFITYKTDFFKTYSSFGTTVRKILNRLDSNEIELAKKIIESSEIKEEDMDTIASFYSTLKDDFKPLMYPNEEDFYHSIKTNIVEGKESLDSLFYLFEEKFSPEEINKFFTYNPNFLQEVKNKLMIEYLVDLKYKYSNSIPKSILDQISLPMTEEVLLDGDDIEPLIYDDRDGTARWVKYFIDDELWEHTMGWDYHDTTIPFDDISDQNLELIKKYLKDNGVEIDGLDRDELDGVMMENDEIETVLKRAANEGARSGDEIELINDIKKVLTELFLGGWKHVDGGIQTTLNLTQLDTDEIKYGFDNCGNWSIKCIWLDQMGERENRSKPSLPEYRYGINGDFDTENFNHYIEEGINEIT